MPCGMPLTAGVCRWSWATFAAGRFARTNPADSPDGTDRAMVTIDGRIRPEPATTSKPCSGARGCAGCPRLRHLVFRSVRHLDLRQALRVHHIVFLDDAVPEQQERRQRVRFVRRQTSRAIVRHRAVDEVPDHRGERPRDDRVVALVEAALAADENGGGSFLAGRAVARRARALGEHQRALRGAAAAGRQ